MRASGRQGMTDKQARPVAALRHAFILLASIVCMLMQVCFAQVCSPGSAGLPCISEDTEGHCVGVWGSELNMRAIYL